jgi:hypothetical protein
VLDKIADDFDPVRSSVQKFYAKELSRDLRSGNSEAGSDNSMPSSCLHFGAHPATCKTAATIATIASEIGKKTFQPSRIN